MCGFFALAPISNVEGAGLWQRDVLSKCSCFMQKRKVLHFCGNLIETPYISKFSKILDCFHLVILPKKFRRSLFLRKLVHNIHTR